MTVNHKRLVAIAVGAIAIAGQIFLVDSPINSGVTANPVVLFVGDFGPSGFGTLVDEGVKVAYDSISTSDEPFTLKRVRFNEPGFEALIGPAFGGAERSLGTLQQRLVREIANDNVIAIIAANSSATASTVLDIGRTFHIPVLLTVATNDALLENHTTALRLLARDSLQAEAITHWSQTQIDRRRRGGRGTGRVAVFYDPRQYGADLQELLRRGIGSTELLPFPLGTTTETAGIITYARQLGARDWILLAYQAQAIEFYAKKRALGVRGSLLMSDGAYGEWLLAVTDSETVISFPESETQSSSEHRLRTQISGYGVFGYDGMFIISEALKTSARKHLGRRFFAQELKNTAVRLSDKGNLMQQYEFDDHGENIRARFHVYKPAMLFPSDHEAKR